MAGNHLLSSCSVTTADSVDLLRCTVASPVRLTNVMSQWDALEIRSCLVLGIGRRLALRNR